MLSREREIASDTQDVCHPSSMHQINDTYGVLGGCGRILPQTNTPCGQLVSNGPTCGPKTQLLAVECCLAHALARPRRLAKPHARREKLKRKMRGGGGASSQGLRQSRTPTLTYLAMLLSSSGDKIHHTKKPIVGCLAPWTNRPAGLSSQSSIDDGAVRVRAAVVAVTVATEDCLGCSGSSILHRKPSFSSKSNQDCRPIER